MQQISLGWFIEWETSVYFCPLFEHFKTLLTTLTNSAMVMSADATDAGRMNEQTTKHRAIQPMDCWKPEFCNNSQTEL